jgi:hypothetical protein
MKRRTIFAYAVVSLALWLTGCAGGPHYAQPSVKWRAPYSTWEENLATAKELCPLGTTARKAKNLLGYDGHLTHYYGPTVRGSGIKDDLSSRPGGNHDYWALEYEIRGGKISLVLNLPAGVTSLEDAVVTSIGWVREIPLTGLKTVPH